MIKCSDLGCDKDARVKGRCTGHYQAHWRREKRMRCGEPARGPGYWDARKQRETGFNTTLFERCLELQGGVCAIYGTPFEPTGACRLNRDHDHQTGEPRGLLSFAANTALGAYEKMLARGGRRITEFDAYLAHPPAKDLL